MQNAETPNRLITFWRHQKHCNGYSDVALEVYNVLCQGGTCVDFLAWLSASNQEAKEQWNVSAYGQQTVFSWSQQQRGFQVTLLLHGPVKNGHALIPVAVYPLHMRQRFGYCDFVPSVDLDLRPSMGHINAVFHYHNGDHQEKLSTHASVHVNVRARKEIRCLLFGPLSIHMPSLLKLLRP